MRDIYLFTYRGKLLITIGYIFLMLSLVYFNAPLYAIFFGTLSLLIGIMTIKFKLGKSLLYTSIGLILVCGIANYIAIRFLKLILSVFVIIQ